MIDRLVASSRRLIRVRPAHPRLGAGYAAIGAALALGLDLMAPAASLAQRQDSAAAQQQGGAPEAALDYARWAEEVLAQSPDDVQILDRLEQRIFELVNQRRRDERLDPLEPSEQLKPPARAHAISQLQGEYFAHEAPGGRSAGDRVALLARRFVGRPAENLFELTGASPPFSQEDIERLARTVVDSLMTSPGHRANILGEEYDELAVGAAVRGNRTVITQVFGDRVATLDEPLPLTVEAGTELSLDVTAAGDGRAPTRYDYYRPEEGRTATLSLELDSPLAMTEPGRYRLRFYVPRGDNTFDGYFGPDIVVR